MDAFLLKLTIKYQCQACNRVTWEERNQFGVDLNFGSKDNVDLFSAL